MDPYSRASYDISHTSDWSIWNSKPTIYCNLYEKTGPEVYTKLTPVCVRFRYFEVGENNGQLRAVKAVDYEEKNLYFVVVVATDSAVDSRSSSINITVEVKQVISIII